MDHGGEAARPTTVRFPDLRMAGAIQVQGGEAHMSTGTFHGQRSAAAARRAGFEPSAAAYHNSAEFPRHVRATAGRGEVPGGGFRRQLGLVDVALLGPHLPDGVVQVLDNYGYDVLQPRPGAGRGVVLVGLLPAGARHGGSFVGQLPVPGGGGVAYDGYDYYALPPRPDDYGYYVWQPRLGAGRSELLVDLLPDDAGRGEVFVGLLPGGGGAMHDDCGYYAWQPHPGAGHGEVFVGLLPGSGGAVLDGYGYYPRQPHPGVGSDEVFIGTLADGVGVVFGGLGDFAQQTLPGPGTRRANGIDGALRYPNLDVGYDGHVALAVDIAAGYDNRGIVAEHLRRLLPFAGVGACSVAVNGLAGGPSSPANAFRLFVLLLAGLFLVIMHVLRA